MVVVAPRASTARPTGSPPRRSRSPRSSPPRTSTTSCSATSWRCTSARWPISVARPGWLGSTPLGVVCAIALKPAIGPYLVWLAIRRPRDFLRTLAVGLAVSAVFAVVVGPGPLRRVPRRAAADERARRPAERQRRAGDDLAGRRAGRSRRRLPRDDLGGSPARPRSRGRDRPRRLSPRPAVDRLQLRRAAAARGRRALVGRSGRRLRRDPRRARS